MGPFLAGESERALSDAARAVEARSSAEVVIAVRARSGDPRSADLTAALAAGAATLAFGLFSPWPFPTVWLFLDPLIAGLVAAVLVARVPALRRALTPLAVRRERVTAAAKATFLEMGVYRTSGRTGILVYVSLLERLALVVVDDSVEDAVPRTEWAAAVDAIDLGVRSGEDGVRVAARIERLGDLLEPVLPRSSDDVNELPDDVCTR